MKTLAVALLTGGWLSCAAMAQDASLTVNPSPTIDLEQSSTRATDCA
jgi:hypothetical protein